MGSLTGNVPAILIGIRSQQAPDAQNVERFGKILSVSNMQADAINGVHIWIGTEGWMIWLIN